MPFFYIQLPAAISISAFIITYKSILYRAFLSFSPLSSLIIDLFCKGGNGPPSLSYMRGVRVQGHFCLSLLSSVDSPLGSQGRFGEGNAKKRLSTLSCAKAVLRKTNQKHFCANFSLSLLFKKREINFFAYVLYVGV